MASTDEREGRSPLDEWIASAGAAAVATAVEDARRRIAEGSTSGFTDKRSFLDHLRQGPRQTA